MRWLLVAIVLFACNRGDEAPSGVRQPPPVSNATSSVPDAAVAEPTPAVQQTPEPASSAVEPPTRALSVGPGAALANLDTMLSEIDRAWRKDKSSILKPAARPGFRVFDDNGVAMIFPDVELSMAVVEQRLRARAKNVKNKDMKMYTDGTLVAIDPTSGQRVSNEPAIVALNETLIIFIIPALDPVRVGRIDVAKP